MELTLYPQDFFFCAVYLTVKPGIVCKYGSTPVSLLLTKPWYKTKEERGLQRGTQPEREGEQCNGFYRKLN